MADSKRARKMPANVLVVDDDAQAVSLVKAVLRPFNVRVSAVETGRAGIEQALRNKPDLVILQYCINDEHISNYIQPRFVRLNRGSRGYLQRTRDGNQLAAEQENGRLPPDR